MIGGTLILLLVLYVLSYAPFYLVHYCMHTPQQGDWRPLFYEPLNWLCTFPFFASLAGSYFEFYMEHIHGDIVQVSDLHIP